MTADRWAAFASACTTIVARVALGAIVISLGLQGREMCEARPNAPASSEEEFLGAVRPAAAEARRILAAYHQSDPMPAERLLHVVCWRCKDRDFAEGHRERLDRILTHIQGFYADWMERHGLGRRSIRLARDDVGRLVVHEVVAEGVFADYGMPDGNRIRQECVPVLRAAGIDASRETVMIFTNLVDWNADTGVFRHKSPYYAGGDAAGGTAWQLDSAELDILNLGLREPIVDDGQYGRISLGKHNSIFIGGIAHELGHALGLPHCRERPDEAFLGTALMGSGNRTYGDELRQEGKGSFLTLAHSLRLAAHPQFTGSVKGLGEDPDGRFERLALERGFDGSSFRLTGWIRSDIPVHAVIAYLDPQGGGDYDARTCVGELSTLADRGPEETGFSILCDAFVEDRTADMRLVACHANGGITSLEMPYRVEGDGSVDVAAMQAGLACEGFLEALDRDGPVAAARALESLPEDSLARRLAAAALAAASLEREQVDAAAVPADRRSVPLSRILPADVSVGWARPTYDRLPRRDALLLAAGEAFETGIYAHAPARHRYRLAGGWKRLSGSCGLPVQQGGSIVCAIRVDGKEVFRSKTLRPGELARYDVDLTGGSELELVTEDSGDGRAADWATWFDPTLHRGE